MADAPASGGGSGWGALEIGLAVILGIGLIATLTGTPITPLLGNTPSAKKTADTAPAQYAMYGCTFSIASPTPKQLVTTDITVSGTVASCTDTNTVPEMLNVQMIDSLGTPVSNFASLEVSKDIFGDAHFSGTVSYVDAARTTNGFVIIQGLSTSAKNADIRIPIKLVIAKQTVPNSNANQTAGSRSTLF